MRDDLPKITILKPGLIRSLQVYGNTILGARRYNEIVEQLRETEGLEGRMPEIVDTIKAIIFDESGVKVDIKYTKKPDWDNGIYLIERKKD